MNINSSDKFSRLKRERYPMPNFVRDALIESDLMNAYFQRPAYQQNDYLGWIIRSKKKETKLKRLNQMLRELEIGDEYMNMDYNPHRLK